MSLRLRFCFISFFDPCKDILIHILPVHLIQDLMPVAFIQMDRHIFDPGIFIFLIDSDHILSESPYRVIGSCRKEHRKCLRNPFHASFPYQNLHTGKHLIIGSQCKCIGTQRIPHIFISFFLIGCDPFLRCLTRFKFLIETSKTQYWSFSSC